MLLDHYFRIVGRGSQARLAKAIGAHSPDVARWASGKRPVPVERCVPIEQATGGKVTRRDLRPDDWHLIWPELSMSDMRSSQPPEEAANA